MTSFFTSCSSMLPKDLSEVVPDDSMYSYQRDDFCGPEVVGG